MQDLYKENFGILLRVIKEDLNKRKDIIRFWIEGFYVVKMLILFKKNL